MSSPLVRDPDPRDPAAGPLAAAPEAPSPGGARTAEAVIDLAAIAGNLRIFREHTDAPVLAVVKADGYGHGAVQVARTALAHGASWLGVSFIAEALALRGAGIQAPILAFTHLPDEDATQAVLADVDLSVSTEAQREAIAQSAGRLGRTAQVHLELDTGLHHDGASPAQWPDLLAAAARLEAKGTVHVRGLWSHLVHPDEPEHPTTLRQLDDFEAAIALAEEAGLSGRIAHLASSAAVLTIPRSHHGLVRIGRGLYGVEPVARALLWPGPADDAARPPRHDAAGRGGRGRLRRAPLPDHGAGHAGRGAAGLRGRTAAGRLDRRRGVDRRRAPSGRRLDHDELLRRRPRAERGGGGRRGGALRSGQPRRADDRRVGRLGRDQPARGDDQDRTARCAALSGRRRVLGRCRGDAAERPGGRGPAAGDRAVRRGPGGEYDISCALGGRHDHHAPRPRAVSGAAGADKPGAPLDTRSGRLPGRGVRGAGAHRRDAGSGCAHRREPRAGARRAGQRGRGHPGAARPVRRGRHRPGADGRARRCAAMSGQRHAGERAGHG